MTFAQSQSAFFSREWWFPPLPQKQCVAFVLITFNIELSLYANYHLKPKWKSCQLIIIDISLWESPRFENWTTFSMLTGRILVGMIIALVWDGNWRQRTARCDQDKHDTLRFGGNWGKQHSREKSLLGLNNALMMIFWLSANAVFWCRGITTYTFFKVIQLMTASFLSTVTCVLFGTICIYAHSSDNKNLLPLENILNAVLRRKLKGLFYFYNLQQKNISFRKSDT